MFRVLVCSLALALLCLAGATYAGKPSAEIADESSFRGGQALSLRGLRASESIETDLALVNLAQTANRCTLALADGNGFGIGPVISLTLTAREERPFLNVFERLIEGEGIADAQATVSCSRDFYAYALLANRADGRADLVTPEASYDQVALERLSAPVAACPAGAACFDAAGLVHVPEAPPGRPIGRVVFPTASGVAKRFRLSLDVTVGDWFPEESDGKHLIYWFVINKNKDMPGLLYFRGPGKNQAFARHGVQLTHPEKIKIIKPFAAEPGRTYHVDNDYDMARQTYKVTVTDVATGAVKVTLVGKPNLASYLVKARSKFIIDMGFYPGLVETEVPSYGWKYSDLHVEAYMQ